jgi:hypothetical protein
MESKGRVAPGEETLLLDQKDLAVLGKAGVILKKLMRKDERRRFHSDRPCVRQERALEQTVQVILTPPCRFRKSFRGAGEEKASVDGFAGFY